MNIRQFVLSTKRRSCLILFGDGSEIGIYKTGESAFAGISLRGLDVRKSTKILHSFRSHGGEILECTPTLSILGQTRRVALVKFVDKAKLLAALNSLRKLDRGCSKFLVLPTKPVILWEAMRK